MKIIKFGEIANVTMGVSPSSEYYRYDGEGKPFMQGITTFGDIYPYIDTWTEKYSKLAKQNSILFAVRAPVGKVNIAQSDIAIGRGLASIEAKSDSNKFLFYVIKANEKAFLAKSNGTVYDSINIKDILNTKVCVPREEVRNKITNILNKYDDLIENNNCRIKLLENMAEEIYKEWFVRFRFPEYEKAIFIDGIPKGWQYKKFNEIFKYIRGVSYSSEEIESDDGIDFVNLKNIQSYGGFRRDGLKKYNGKYKEEQKVKYHDLVMGVTDMTQERRTVGAVALIPKIDGVITMDLIKLVSETDNTFWYCLFKYGYYSQMISQFGNGANVIHLRPESIKNQKILFPSKEIIDKFTKIISPIFDEIEELYLSIDNLSKQRDLLLPRLMSGKIDLTNKEIV